MRTAMFRSAPIFTLGLLVLFASMVSSACSTPTRPDGEKGLLEPGMKAPSFKAEDHRGETIEFPLGAPSVVFFYPKDGTPGCTKEACAFRDAFDRYEEAGIRLIGVSADSLESHREFAEEHGLQFSLLTDEGEIGRAFGVARTFGMHKRRSFLIDGEGVVRKSYPDVDPGVHAGEILKDAAELGIIQ